jgi:dUTP pyrophosphatase
MKIQVKQTKGLQIPKAATSKSAGYDVLALTDFEIVGNQIEASAWKSIDYVEYHTGLFTSPQTDEYRHDYHTLIFPRSSVSKYNLILANCIGLVDNDYRGELILRFKYIWQPEDFTAQQKQAGGQFWEIFGNPNEEKMYKKGDKIGQLVSDITIPMDWMVVAELDLTQRGEGGFGSTDNVKTMAERFAQKPTVEEIAKETFTIIDQYQKAGGVPTPMPYSEQVKQRNLK